MDIHELLDTLRPSILEGDWPRVESTAWQHALPLAGRAQLERIRSISTSDYERQLRAGVLRAGREVESRPIRALYFEYDLDNDWQSGFFLCQDYNAEVAHDEDWACDWLVEFRGPELPELGAIYLENHFDRTPLARGSTLYLVARTVVAFGHALAGHSLGDIAVCVGFHDQDSVFRLREAV